MPMPQITIMRSGDALDEFRPSGIRLDAVVAKGPDLLGERAINRLTQRDVGAMIARGLQKMVQSFTTDTRAVRLCVGDHESRPDMRARISDQSRGWRRRR